MKYIFKKILQYYLKYITKLVLFIHRPTVVAIAGSTNKTFVKNEVMRVIETTLEDCGVRANPKSFNTEIGLPLAILNLPSGYNFYKNWLPAILRAPLAVFQADFPKYLVLELGVSDPGDMKYLLSIVKPKISVVTDITQRYREGFADMDRLVGEYECLVRKTLPGGLVALNYDNHRVRGLARLTRKYENTKTRKQKDIVYFGFEDGADWRAVEVKKEKYGQKIKMCHNNTEHEHKIKRFGKHHVYALLIGLIVKQYMDNPNLQITSEYPE